MTSKHDAASLNKALETTGANRPGLGELPGYVDGIPVQELVRIARELTDRINNEDRQRLAADLNESGHSKTSQNDAPYLLQGFLAGKLDLDIELNRRFPSPPLLSTMTFAPKPGQIRRHGFAQFTSQDTAATMTMEIHSATNMLECTFLHYSMIGLRFTLGPLQDVHRRRVLEQIERPSGIAVLWTRERWQHDYLIFVIRERFARIFAFGPGRVEAACRLTPDALTQLRLWLAGFWENELVTKSGTDPSATSW